MSQPHNNIATDVELLSEEKVARALDRLKGLLDAGLDLWDSPHRASAAPRTSARAGTPARHTRIEPRFTTPDDDQPTMEQAIGQELTALIRSRDDLEVESHALVTPAVRVLPPGRSTEPMRKRFMPRPRKIADLVGALLTAAGIWAGYQWFQSLPDGPSTSPWSLLGKDQPSTEAGQADPRPGQAHASGVAERPLGQYIFNGSWEQRAPEDRLWRAPAVAYDRVQMLEAAFDIEYVPPPDCLDWRTDADMVRCANHQMRARRAFVESGGTVTPDMLGIDKSADAFPSPEESSPTSDWRWDDTRQTYTDPEQPWSPTWQQIESGDGTWDSRLGQEEGPDWEGDTRFQGEDWRRQEYVPEAGGWLREQDGIQEPGSDPADRYR